MVSKEYLDVPMPEVEQWPSGEYAIVVPDDETGHGSQVFKAATLDELCAKLGSAQQHGTRRIRELNRELREIREDYAITRDVANLLAALLMVKHASNDAPVRALDKVIRSMTKDLTARLPESDEPKK